MSSVNLRFINVYFSYSTTSENIVSSLNVHFGRGWTGISGPNGAGKTTVAKLATGLLIPFRGTVTGLNPGTSAIYCEQETETPPAHAENFLFSSDNRSGELKSLLAIETVWLERWNTLSFGERKRFQTGVALWLEPEILALDEPTNHLDSSARRLIADALKTYDGTGILISHDRDLMDALCSSTLFIKPGIAVLRPGGVTAGLAQEELESISREREYSLAGSEAARMKRSLNLLKQKENGRRHTLSKKNIDKKDRDAKGKIDLARLTGKDKTASRKIRLLENRVDSMIGDAESKYFKRRNVDGFTYNGERYRGDRIAHIPAAGINMGETRLLEIPELDILPSDRIGITGDNGTGKSTLLRHIRSSMKLPEDKIIYIPQEVSRAEWTGTFDVIKRLPGRDMGELLSVVHRLGSEPERILETENPSPGEIRKMMLGLGLLKTPVIIMMDEPTNHMDLPSVQCLEDALSSFDGALILVSHDRRFLNRLISAEWILNTDGERTILSIKN